MLKAKQIKQEERKDEDEKSTLKQMEKKKSIQSIKSKTSSIKSEWDAKTDALIN